MKWAIPFNDGPGRPGSHSYARMFRDFAALV